MHQPTGTRRENSPGITKIRVSLADSHHPYDLVQLNAGKQGRHHT
jgi:hypothetical protein